MSSWKGNVILEVVANFDLCIGHALFGMVGSHNDYINVLHNTPMFVRLVEGQTPKCKDQWSSIHERVLPSL
jgi:hypothetical protein